MTQNIKKYMNNIFDKKPLNLKLLKLQAIYSFAKYDQVSCEAIALKICHDTEHQKVAEQHINDTKTINKWEALVDRIM